VGKVQVSGAVPEDAAEVERFMEAQRGLSSALSRLLVVAENYPELRATQAFRDLQSQLEGNENRIAVARRDYIDAVQRYNTNIRKFPNSFIASSFGFERVAQLEPDEEKDVTAVPVIDFEDE
jgi:LemA protein